MNPRERFSKVFLIIIETVNCTDLEDPFDIIADYRVCTFDNGTKLGIELILENKDPMFILINTLELMEKANLCRINYNAKRIRSEERRVGKEC